jgi:uncharacterized DUF497 family protein
MDLDAAGFDWHADNRDKCQRHGVSLAGIEGLFHRPLGVFPDPAHSSSEERFKAIGKTDQRRSVLIVFTLRRRREGAFVRPISGRYMHRKEIESYEKEAAEARQRRSG